MKRFRAALVGASGYGGAEISGGPWTSRRQPRSRFASVDATEQVRRRAPLTEATDLSPSCPRRLLGVDLFPSPRSQRRRCRPSLTGRHRHVGRLPPGSAAPLQALRFSHPNPACWDLRLHCRSKTGAIAAHAVASMGVATAIELGCCRSLRAGRGGYRDGRPRAPAIGVTPTPATPPRARGQPSNAQATPAPARS
jgi:hypothetical protein